MQPNKLDIQSTDITAENLTKIQELFPSAIKEGKVDVDALRNLFGDIVEPNQEYYNFTWAGKSDCFKIIKEQTTATLKPVKEESVNFDDTENIFIEGDNLEVLKTLQKTYHGKVKMIYIDPPYNKDKDFVYPDRWSEGLADYLEYAKLVDEEGNIKSSDAESESVKQGRKHSRWLSMMYPRLFLAKNLLQDEGAIFISIDNDEIKNLRMVCDEIFGEENFVAELVWKKKTGAGSSISHVFDEHEYVLSYAKTKEKLPSWRILNDEDGNFTNPDDDERGPWESCAFTAPSKNRNQNQLFMIEIHYDYNGREIDEFDSEGRKCFDSFNYISHKIVLREPKNSQELAYTYYDNEKKIGKFVRRWAYAKQNIQQIFEQRRVYFNGGNIPRFKKFETEYDGKALRSIYFNEFSTQQGTDAMSELFGESYVEYPKPVNLIKHFVEASTSENDIILDFFAGSGTTAESIFNLNATSLEKRKFILVQLPEITDEQSEAYLAGYRTIAEISKERIRRAGAKIAEENSDVDKGFKVFKLDSSNFMQWKQDIQDKETLQAQFDLYGDNVKEGADSLDMLYEVIIKKGLSLNSKVTEIEVGSKTMYQVDSEGVELLACFEMEVTKEDIDAVLEANPIYFICLDKAFEGNDQLKTNATLGFKDAEILFETV